MKVDYTRYQRPDGTFGDAPYLEVRIAGTKKAERHLMLVDSGADLTMIPRALGERLGIDTSGEVLLRGLGGEHRASLGEPRFSFRGETFLGEVALADVDEDLMVLGHRDFFAHFWVAFETPARRFFVSRHRARQG